MEFKTPPTLFYFSVYKDEDIYFFYPNTFSEQDRKKHVGLSSALCNFSRTFRKSLTVDSVHSQKHRLICLQTEDGYFVTMNLNLGFIIRHLSTQKRTIEFLSDSVNDDNMQAFLKALIDAFQLQHGTISLIIQSRGQETLHKLMTIFFSSLLEALDFESISFKQSIPYIRYLSPHKVLNIQLLSLVNCIQAVYPQCIEHVMILVNGALAWTTLGTKETLSIYTYLCRFVRHRFIDVDASRFLTLPDSLKSLESPEFPLLSLKFLDAEYNTIVYSLMESKIFLFVKNTAENALLLQNISFYKDVEDCIESRFEKMKPNIAEVLKKKALATKNFDHLYFNRQTLSLREIGHFPLIEGSYSFAEVKKDLDNGEATEIFLKTIEDRWIIGRSCLDRQFFSAVSKKDVALADVEEEFKSMKSIAFNNIFFE